MKPTLETLGYFLYDKSLYSAKYFDPQEWGMADQCYCCKYLTSYYTCSAFSTGIPEEIQNAEFLHDKQFSNETILFSPERNLVRKLIEYRSETHGAHRIEIPCIYCSNLCRDFSCSKNDSGKLTVNRWDRGLTIESLCDNFVKGKNEYIEKFLKVYDVLLSACPDSAYRKNLSEKEWMNYCKIQNAWCDFRFHKLAPETKNSPSHDLIVDWSTEKLIDFFKNFDKK